MNKIQMNNIHNENGDVKIDQSINKNKITNKIKTIVSGKGSRSKIVIRVTIVFVIAIVLFYIISALKNTPEKKIIGTWQIDEQPQIYATFGENGAFSMSGDGDYLDGNYIFISDNTVQIHMNYLWADFVISGDISIKGTTMTISNMRDPDDIFGGDGATLTLTRTK